jgi:hypothetical protein
MVGTSIESETPLLTMGYLVGCPPVLKHDQLGNRLYTNEGF